MIFYLTLGIPPPPYNNLSIKVSGLFNLLKRCPKVKAYIHPQDIPFVLKGNPGMMEVMPIDTSDYYLTNYYLSDNNNSNNNNVDNGKNEQANKDKEDDGDNKDDNGNDNKNLFHFPNLSQLSLHLSHLSSNISSHFSSHLSSPQEDHINSCRIIPTSDNFILPLGTLTTLKFLHMPGHTQGSQSILVNECRLFTGDTLMCGCIGRLDLPGGDLAEMKITLKDRLGNLSDDIVIYPGHNYGGDWTTIGIEREKGVIGNIKRK